jgi:hypothetical protein
MKFDQEFKDAISDLSDKEKDKLILRLLKRDPILAKRLQFELLGHDSAEERRALMEDTIRERVRQIAGMRFNAGFLALEMRSLSGSVTEHVKVTKDKVGEASLNLLMLNEVLNRYLRDIEQARRNKSDVVVRYIVARAFKLLVLIRALHEDYLSDFKEDLHTLGELFGRSDLFMHAAIRNGLDVNWLLEGEIPENIREQQAELRKMGFLR